MEFLRFCRYNLRHLDKRGSVKLYQDLFMQDDVINYNIETEDGWTPIHLFCRYFKHSNLFQFLDFFISKGADANAKTNEGWNPLHFLFRNVSELLDSGFDLIGLSMLLIDNGADVNAITSMGWTPLHFVCQYWDSQNIPIKLINFLVEVYHADLNAMRSDDRDTTPRDLLAQKGCYKYH